VPASRTLLHAGYGALLHLDDAWCRLAADTGGRAERLGASAEGRPLVAWQWGPRDRPAVLLTALMHGSELIGGLALLAVVQDLLQTPERLNLVVLPCVNPDAVAYNLERLQRGLRTGRRGNARGVDLNRNFPWITDRRPWHPFAGSRFRLSPHYTGPAPASEPETRAVMAAAAAVRPKVAVGFHSFGNLLLYPWAHTERPHPARAEYEGLAAHFTAAQAAPYEVRPACGLYPTVGDLDDWLDHALGTRAFTVELGRPDRRILAPRRFVDPAAWMNALEPEAVIANVRPGVRALVAAGVGDVQVGLPRQREGVAATRLPRAAR
jgi:carboxypeptidase T